MTNKSLLPRRAGRPKKEQLLVTLRLPPLASYYLCKIPLHAPPLRGSLLQASRPPPSKKTPIESQPRSHPHPHPHPQPDALPPSPPPSSVVVRGHVYCAADFPWRAADWFRQEQQRQAEVAEQARRDAGLPTRVQPPRAAKRKHREDVATLERLEMLERLERLERPLKRARCVTVKTAKTVKTAHTRNKTRQLPPPFSPPAHRGYVLVCPLEYGRFTDIPCRDSPICVRKNSLQKTAADIFRCRVAAVVAERRAVLLRREKRRSVHSPDSQACPLTTRPLDCTELAYCLHGWRGADRTTESAAVAPMEDGRDEEFALPCATDTADLATRTDPELAAHLNEQTVEICGLRFAVDMCDGGVRVVMV